MIQEDSVVVAMLVVVTEQSRDPETAEEAVAGRTF
jgi:hypothetical protein